MRKLVLFAGAVAAMLALCLQPGSAQAQSLLTFVSGTGDDTNGCFITSPCQTWAGALAKTAAGGQIVAIGPGNFGSVTITHAITIDGGAGQAAVSFASGGTVFIINAGASDVVTLRNLQIAGFGQTAFAGVNGILINSAGVVHIENCNIYGFSKNGVVVKNSASSKLVINDTTISDNLNGVQLGPTGAVTPLNATFERVHIHNNSNAGIFLNPGAGGLANLALNRSTVTVNGTGILVETNGSVFLNDTQIAESTINGVTVVNGGIAGSFVNNPITDNVNGSLNDIPLK